MKLPFNILFLGWCFSGQRMTSDGQPYPQPSISVTPSNVVALGGNVSIHCMSENYLQMEFYLEKDERKIFAIKKAEQPEVIFPILNAKAEDGGTYQCIYHSITGEGPWSFRSDKIYINVTDPSLIKPSIKLQGEPFVGMTVTIECQGPEHNLTFSLHKFRNHTATQVIPPTGSTNHFPFHTLSLEDAGNYTCQYHRRENPFVWSGPSDSVELIVIDHASAVTNIRQSAAVLVSLVLVLIVIEAVHSWKKGQL
ncbi:T-cell-interacting, activating receptor on myeloid cells protein 1-like isoform X2 [Tiliqua scincoides]|uniref:T-cell-interacting, activating receptor on myeloid cells protein 1-like isoform X2 n=1 Tax=Tiliqua scincoides TaxID=71010 RepID=UPI00346182F5